MKIKSERDFWSGLMFTAAGIVFAVGATHYTMGSAAAPGPGYFPLLLGVILALLGAVVLFKSLTIEADGGDPIGPIAWRPLLVVILAIAVFATALPRLGFFITVPLLIVIVSWAGEEFSWRGVLVMAAVLTLCCWLIFVVGLKLPLPLWPSFALIPT